MVDPGIGFGKTVEHNLALLRHLDRFTALGRPVVLGTSRKRFLGAILGAEPGGRAPSAPWPPRSSACSRGRTCSACTTCKPNFEALRVELAVLEGAPAA